MSYVPTITVHDVKDATECERAIAELFETIEEFQGEEKTRRMFAPYGRSLTPTDISERKNFALLLDYYTMLSPNKQKLTERLVRINKTLPQDKRYGPRGTTSPETLLRHLNRLLKEKRYLALRTEAADIGRWLEESRARTKAHTEASDPLDISK